MATRWGSLRKSSTVRRPTVTTQHTGIKLRERGTKKLHVFTGERVQVDKPKGAPAWMPDKIWKPVVKKVGTETLEEL
jgi:hypothetical protein